MPNEQPIAPPASPPDWKAIVAACRAAGLTKDEAQRQLRLHWPRRRTGRKPDAAIDAALTMRDAGQSWLAIYRTAIPNFSSLSRFEREVRASSIRRGVRDRRRRRKLALVMRQARTSTADCASIGAGATAPTMDHDASETAIEETAGG